MISATPCCRISPSATAMSPASPLTKVARPSIAHSNPVERSSSTTTSSPASSSRSTMWLPI
jgi:hypothetical protein